MFLKLMYITNDIEVAKIAQKYGVDRIWIDLETLGKEERQGHLDSVKSNHSIEDIKKIKPLLNISEMLVRVNPINESSIEEINQVIEAGADMIMLPMWKSFQDVKTFLEIIKGRVKTTLLLETKEAVQCLDEVLKNGGFDEIHIGLNDLHLSYNLSFMFEPLTNGIVEGICEKIKKYNIPYGFGGIAKLGEGKLPAEKILMEHYRLGSSRVILSRSFCNANVINNINEIENIFKKNLNDLYKYEEKLEKKKEEDFIVNKLNIKKDIELIIKNIYGRKFKMNFNYEKINEICKVYGDAYYLLDSEQFKKNFIELKESFSRIYHNFNIAYSYKTNYIPKFCRIVNELGGYAEVVSDMEMEIALRIGVSPEKIIWNGPYKNLKKVEELLLIGGTVNLDSEYELSFIEKLAQQYPKKTLNIGIRCNFEINDNVVSRFGFDINSKEFKDALMLTKEYPNLYLIGLQCHFATRALKTWKPRVEKMLDLLESLKIVPDHIDLGGGLFGKMDESLKKQFDTEIPSYNDYAEEVAVVFAKHFKNKTKQPLMLIEPGSALVGDCMKFISRVVNIKNIRGKSIATLLGSIYNINPTLNTKNPPLTILKSKNQSSKYENLDFGGFTCIESDYLYRHYTGELAVGDIVVFGNVGSYSVVLKPPFILPNFPVLDICNEKEIEVIKRQEYFDDIFHTFKF